MTRDMLVNNDDEAALCRMLIGSNGESIVAGCMMRSTCGSAQPYAR